MMIDYSDRDTALGYTEQLYTPRGSQGFGTYDKITSLGVEPSQMDETVLLLSKMPNARRANYKLRPLFTTKLGPDFIPNSM